MVAQYGNPQTQALIKRSKYLEDAIKGLQNTSQSQFNSGIGTAGHILSNAILAYSGKQADDRANEAMKADQQRLTDAILGTPQQANAGALNAAGPVDLTPGGFEGRAAGVDVNKLRAIAEMGGPMALLQYQEQQDAKNYDRGRDARTDFVTDRSFDRGVFVDDRNFDYRGKRDSVSDDQWRMGYEQQGEQFAANQTQDALQFGESMDLNRDQLAEQRRQFNERLAAEKAEAEAKAAAAANGGAVFEGPQLATIYNKSMDALADAEAAQSDLSTIAATAQQFLDVVGDDNWIQGDNIISDLMQAGSFKTTELKALTDRIAPLMRRPGSGASSDTDVKMFKNSVVNVNNTPEANKRFAQGAVAMAKRNQEYIDFLNQAITPSDPQSRQKANQLWGLYKNDEPLFDEKTGAVLPSRPFSEWLQENMGEAAPAPPPATDDDVDDLIRKWGGQ